MNSPKRPLEDINIYTPIEHKLPQIIEYFVMFYGEKYRSIITKRLSSAIFIYADKPEFKTYNIIKDYFYTVKNNLAKEMLAKFKVSNVEENAKFLQDKLSSMAKLEKCSHDITLINDKDILEILNCFEVLGKEKQIKYINIKNLPETPKETLREIVYEISKLWKIYSTRYDRIEEEYKRIYDDVIAEQIEYLPEEKRSDAFNALMLNRNIYTLHQEDLLFERELFNLIRDYVYSPKDTGAFTYVTAKRYNPKQAVPVCVSRSGLWMYDYFTVHELNHVVESDVKVLKNKMKVKYGFTEEDVDLKTSVSMGITPYPYFDEVINDYLSYCIFLKMKDDGFKICLHDYSPSTYSIAFPLLDRFIIENIHDITECRITKSYKDFAKIIGEENYSNLARITHELVTAYSPNHIYDDAVEEISKYYKKDVDIYAFLDSDNRQNVSEKTKEFLKYFEDARKVLNDIKAYKSRPKTIRKKVEILSEDDDEKVDN